MCDWAVGQYQAPYLIHTTISFNRLRWHSCKHTHCFDVLTSVCVCLCFSTHTSTDFNSLRLGTDLLNQERVEGVFWRLCRGVVGTLAHVFFFFTIISISDPC